jgi:hypothetical protein
MYFYSAGRLDSRMSGVLTCNDIMHEAVSRLS